MPPPWPGSRSCPRTSPSAKTRALEVAARNGYDNTGNNTVTVELGEKPTQLKVTVTEVVKNTFGAAIGVPTTTISQSGTADYQGPAPMGSPCNTFGNEPNAGSGGSSATPAGTAQGSEPAGQLLAHTPVLGHRRGARRPARSRVTATRPRSARTAASTAATSSKNNEEYDDFGYIFVVKVTDTTVGSPSSCSSTTRCSSTPARPARPAPRRRARSATTRQRQRLRDEQRRPEPLQRRRCRRCDDFCTGDSYAGRRIRGADPSHAHDHLVRAAPADRHPEPQGGRRSRTTPAGSACIKQYGTYNTSGNNISAEPVQEHSGSYNDEISSQFHNWVKFCTFTPDRAGDYYLQVRTNVALGGTGGTYIRSGNTAAAAADRQHHLR